MDVRYSHGWLAFLADLRLPAKGPSFDSGKWCEFMPLTGRFISQDTAWMTQHLEKKFVEFIRNIGENNSTPDKIPFTRRKGRRSLKGGEA